MDFTMDLDQLYRLTLSTIKFQSDYYYDHQTDIDVISYASPYVSSQNLKKDFTESYNLDLHKNVVNQDFTNQYIKKYFSPFNTIKSNFVDTGLLSPGLKSFGNNYMVFEKPPCFKNIFYIPASRSDVTDDLDTQQIFRIPIPWQLYFVKFNPDMYTYEVRMFFMKNSLISIDQELFLPPLPNFYTNGMLCPPIMDNMEDVDRYPKNHAGIMDCAYDWVWNSGTNHDLTEACLHIGFQLNQDNSILKHMPELIYNNYFKILHQNISNGYSRYSASSKQVSHLLAAWEKSSLTEVCNFSWPNISGLNAHFIYPDVSSDSENYYDYFYNFIAEQDDTISEDDVAYMIENGDYDSQEYNQYLRVNNLLPSCFKAPWEQSYLYSNVFPELIKLVQNDLGSSESNLSYDINFVNVSNNV